MDKEMMRALREDQAKLEALTGEEQPLDFLYDDPCPECGAQLEDGHGGGVVCPACGYWFCF